jgi:hypothetical protein
MASAAEMNLPQQGSRESCKVALLIYGLNRPVAQYSLTVSILHSEYR